MRYFFLGVIFFFIISCNKEEQLASFNQIQINSSDIIYRVNIDDHNLVTLLGGYVWSHGFSISSYDISIETIKDTFSNKGLFDLLTTEDHKLVSVGTDGYLFVKPDNNSSWNFIRLSNWDILTSVIQTENGYMAAGGKAYETGYVYLLNDQFVLDTVLRFGHEISEVAKVDEGRYVAVGYGNIMISKDAGRHWKILPNEGDFYSSTVFITNRKGYTIGINGTLLITNDGGDSWQKSHSKISKSGFNSFRKIKLIDSKELIIVGNEGKLWRSLDEGIIWDFYQLPTASDIYDIDKKNDSSYIVVGSDGLVTEIKF